MTHNEKQTAIAVLDKTFQVLGIVREGPVSVAEASRLTGVPRPTVHRIMKSLEQQRYVVRDIMGRFAIGPGFTETSASARDPLQSDSDLILRDLRAETAAEACLFWADGIDRICIASTFPADTKVKIGERLAPSPNSAAQVLLAWSGPRRVAARNFTVAQDAASLAQVRHRGWASCAAGHGTACISAPVRNHRGEVIAAVTAMGCATPGTGPTRAPDAAAVLLASSQLTSALARAQDRERRRGLAS